MMTFQEFCDQYHVQGLNEQQVAAVQRVDGATLLLAVPGSGKTTVIVNRTGYLLYGCGIKQENILTLTYTKAAAVEMQNRFIKKFGDALCPKFSTINSFCVSVLRTCAREKGEMIPQLLPNNESFIGHLAAEMMHVYPSDSSIKQLAQQVGKAKNEMMSEKDLDKVKNPDVDFKKFFGQYQAALMLRGQMDFDDQLIIAYDFLKKYPDILERVRRQYKYISLDEAQDTSLIQHRIVELMVGPAGNIFMVGDEDQSIYAFRGAYPAALLDFEHIYKDAKVLLMETNYRSDKKIVDTSNQFIKRNQERNDKNMHSVSDADGKIDVIYPNNRNELPAFLLDLIQKHLAANDGTTMAILYRNNDSIVPTTDLLCQRGITVRQRDSFSLFTNNFLVRDILTWLQFANAPKDMGLFENLYYKMGLYLSKRDLKTIAAVTHGHSKSTSVFDAMTCEVSLYRRIIPQLKRYNSLLKKLPSMKPATAIHTILYDLGYWDYLQSKINRGASEQSFKLKIDSLMTTAAQHKTIAEFLSVMFELGEHVPSDPSSCVTLSTIHSSKGLEFDAVYIVDAVEGILPAYGPQTDIEEEARLFYVGATRAKHSLTFVVPRSGGQQALTKSQFLLPYEIAAGIVKPAEKPVFEPKHLMPPACTPSAALRDQRSKRTYSLKMEQKAAEKKKPDDLSWLVTGCTVQHSLFGIGTVTNLSGQMVEISFEKLGESKKLLLDTCARSHCLSKL